MSLSTSLSAYTLSTLTANSPISRSTLLVVIPNADATSAEVHFLDLAAKLDQTADFECGTKWAIARSPAALGLPGVKSDGKVTIDVGPPMEFPAPFGRELSKEEKYISDMDAKTGASLKLTVLNAKAASGLWLLVVVPPSFTPMPLPPLALSASSPTTVNTQVLQPRPRPTTTPEPFSTSCSVPPSTPRARCSSLVVVLPTSPTSPPPSRVSFALCEKSPLS